MWRARTMKAVFQNWKGWHQPLLKGAAVVLFWDEALYRKVYCAIERCVLKTQPQLVLFEGVIPPGGWVDLLFKYKYWSEQRRAAAFVLTQKKKKNPHKAVRLSQENRALRLRHVYFLAMTIFYDRLTNTNIPVKKSLWLRLLNNVT